jgi:hypothetical protein
MRQPSALGHLLEEQPSDKGHRFGAAGGDARVAVNVADLSAGETVLTTTANGVLAEDSGETCSILTHD